MEDILDVIKTRRSVRAYKSNAVPTELLDKVLEAGTYAPTGKNRQSPVIVAITDKDTRKLIGELNAAVLGADTDPYYGAPVVVLVLVDPSVNTRVEDGACVLENMMLEAHSLGLATVWVHREREIFDAPSGKELLKKWGLNENLQGVGSIALGYASGDLPEAKPRKDGYIVKV